MEKVFSLVSGFLGGLGKLFMAFIPVTILWYVLTGSSVYGMDVIANLTSLVNGFGEGGFVGLVVLILVASFFTDKK
tara:strand:+ start:329 stop:556 length:228 start_codon:yes stop_codon:yes gene_type:complete